MILAHRLCFDMLFNLRYTFLFLNNFANFFENKNKIHSFINIADVPNATISTDNSEVVFGSETKVKSLVASCPKPDGVEWQKSKDGNFFLGIDINKPHYHGSSLNSESPLLLISKTVFDDVLYYRLHVWNKIGEHFSDPLFLDVKGSM